MTQDISNASIRSVYKRSLIPSFDRLATLVGTEKFVPEALDLAKDFIVDDSKDLKDLESNFKLFLDHELQVNLNTVLKELSEDSFTFKYLALISDFHQIQNLYTQHFGQDLEEVQAKLRDLEGKLILKDMYRVSFEHETKELGKYKTIFEYLSHIDHIFFEILMEVAEGESEFIKNFVAHKIDTYNLTAYYRLKELKRSEDFIKQFMISYQFSIPVREIDMDFINRVLAPYMPSGSAADANLIEVAAITRELNYFKKSIFEGVDEPAVIFYLETLKVFFYDLKVLTLAREMNAEKADVIPRLINYSTV